MRRIAFWTLYALFLGLAPGCGPVIKLLPRQPPVDAQCDAQCYLPCDDPLDMSLDGDGNVFLRVSEINRAFLVRCIVRHNACRTCLDGLKKAKVIE